MKILVGIPSLYQDESPASWLTRAALTQGVRVESLMSHLMLPKSSDPDLAMNGMVLWQAATLAGIKTSEFKFAEHMFSGLKKIDPKGHRFLLWTKNGNPRYRFCPFCLNEAYIKYFPLHWRFSAWCWCPKHDCLMYEYCPHCNNEISLPGSMFFAGKNKIGVPYLNRCLKCGERLDDNLNFIPHPIADGLTKDWDQISIENGRAVLSAIFHRKFSLSNKSSEQPLIKLLNLKNMGILPHSLESFSFHSLI